MGLKVINSITGRGGSLIQYPPGFGAFQWLSLDGLWSDAYRWAGGVVPSTGDAPVFNAFVPTGNQNVYLNGNRACGLITVNNPGTTTFLGGTAGSSASNTLTLSAGITCALGCGDVVFGDSIGSALVPITLAGSQSITDNSSNSITFKNNIDCGGNILTVTNSGAGTGVTTLAGVISGNGGTTLIISSSGKTIVSGNNSYSGNTTFNGAGFVSMTGNNAAASGTVTLSSTNVVQVVGSLPTGSFAMQNSNGGIMNSTGSTLNLNNAASWGNTVYYLGNNAALSNSATNIGGQTWTMHGRNRTFTVAALNGNNSTMTFGGGADLDFSGIISNATGLTLNSYGTITLNGSNTFGSSSTITLANSGSQSYLGMIGEVIANGASPFGSTTNTITWNNGSGGNGQQTVINFKCDSADSPVSYTLSTGNNSGNAYLLYLDTATASAGYSRSFTAGNGSTTGLFNSTNIIIVKQGPTATSAMTFNVTNNSHFSTDGNYVPLMNDAGTYGVAMILASVSTISTASRGVNLDGNTTGNSVTGALNNNGTAVLNIRKFGTGTWTLAGAAGTMSGGVSVNGGTLIITGAIASNALAFPGSGTVNFSEAAGSTQAMGTLSSSAGQANVQSTYAGSGSSTLTFSANTAINASSNATSGVINYIATNGANNKIVLTGNTGNRFLNNSATAANTTGGYFFGGSNYGYYDTGGYVRGVNWGVDANTATYAGGTNFTNPAATTQLRQITGTVTAQTAGTVLGHLNISGSVVDLTLAGQIQLWGILKSGTGSSTISGGTIVAGSNNGQFFFRADLASDVLNINSTIILFGTNGLSISGAGTVSLGAANTATFGFVTIGGGATLKLAARGALGPNYPVSPNAGVSPGTQTISVFGGQLDVYGNSISFNTLNVTPGSICTNSSNTPANIRIAAGSTIAGAITDTNAPVALILSGNATFIIGTSTTTPYGYSWQTNTYSGGTYFRGASAGGGTITVAKQNCLGTGPIWLGDISYGSAYSNIGNSYLTTTTNTFSNNNTIYLQSDLNFAGNNLNLGSGDFYLVGNRRITGGNSQGPLTINGNITDGATTASLTLYTGTVTLYPTWRWDVSPYLFPTSTGGHLVLGGNNTLKGGLDIVQGAATATGSSGTPFGVGNITIRGVGSITAVTAFNSVLLINPIQPTDTNISALTTAGTTLSYAGAAHIAFNNQSGGICTFTLGSGSAQTIFTRIGRGTLAINDVTNVALMGGLNKLMIASGSTIPTITNGMLSPTITISTVSSAAPSYATYNATSGFIPCLYDVTGTWAGVTDRSKVYNTGQTLTSSVAIYALTASAAFTINSGVTLTIGDGVNPAGFMIGGARTITGADVTSTIAFRGSEAVITGSNNSQVITATITGTNGLTFSSINSGGTLTLDKVPGWTGTTTVNSGTLRFSTVSGFTMPGDIEGKGVVSFNHSGVVTLAQSAGRHEIGGTNITAATADVVYAGAGSTNIIPGFSWTWTGTPTVEFSSGTWYVGSPGNAGTNIPGVLTVNGASLISSGGRYWQSAGGTTNISSGHLMIWGDRLNPGEQNGSVPITMNVSGTGIFEVARCSQNINIGTSGTANTAPVTLNQTGGTFQWGMSYNGNQTSVNNTLNIGNTTRPIVATYALKGGILRGSGTLQAAGAAFAGGSNNFNWTGGTLICRTCTATNLTCDNGVSAAATGTLFQSGVDAVSNLSPGDYWTTINHFAGTSYQWPGLYSGTTTITGNYKLDTAANASNIVINLSGIVAASAFHDLGIGKYDFVSVSGTTDFNGAANLILNPLPGFIMGTANTLNVLTSTGNILSGALANVARAGTLTVGDITFTVNYPNGAPGSVALTVANAAAINQWGGTSGSNWTTAGSWSNSIIPGSSNTYTARFADAPAATGAITANLDANETINGIAFNSATRNYTISSDNGSSITLDATGYTAAGTGFTGIPAAINCILGTGGHTISTNIILNSDLYINTLNATDTLTLSGNISGSSKSISCFGGGMTVLSGTNTFSGALNILGGTSGLATGVRADSVGALAGVTAFNFHNQYAILLLNFQANFSTSAPIMVIPNNGGALTNTANPSLTSYIGKRGIGTPLGSNTITFSGNITLVGYATLSIQPNSVAGTYVFSGDVNGETHQLNSSGVLNGTTGAGLFFTPTNGVTIKMTGNIGNGIADQPIIPTNCQMLPTGNSSIWMGASGKTVNLYNLYWGGQGAASTSNSKLVMDGDITCYALYNGTNTNIIPQIASNASVGTNTLCIRGSQDMKFQGIIGGSGNENNLTICSRVGGPFRLTLGAVSSFTGGLRIGNGSVYVSAFNASSATATWTAGVTAITVPSTAELLAGMTITGTGIPANSYITYIATATTFFINGTTTGSGATVSFGAGTSIGGTTNTITLGNTDTNESGKLILAGDGQATVASISTVGPGTQNAIVGGSVTTATLTISSSTQVTYAGLFGGPYLYENNLTVLKDGAGTLTITNEVQIPSCNPYSISIDSGTLEIIGTVN